MSRTTDAVIDVLNGMKYIGLRADLVREFVTKQDMSGRKDEVRQFKCIREEVDELNVAWVMNINAPDKSDVDIGAEIEEMADVLETLFVFAEMRGYLDGVEEAFEKKMKVNVKKPVRSGKGVKVMKK